MEKIIGSCQIPNISVNKQQNITAKKNAPEIQKLPEPTAKASAQNVAAYYQNIKVHPVDTPLEVQMKEAATLPNGGYVFRNELDGGKAVVKNVNGSYEVSLIRDGAAKPEEVFTLTEEEFFLNPDLCSGFVIPKADGTYDVTSLDPSDKENFGTKNMKKSELAGFMKEKYFN
jgi:hypothetical protein